MADINSLMASDDPMATPVMALGPAPPANTSDTMGGATAQIHERQVDSYMNSTHALRSPHSSRKSAHVSKLNAEQREAFVVAACAFVILLPNVQQIIRQNAPVLDTNATLGVLSNAMLIAIMFFVVREHVLQVM